MTKATRFEKWEGLGNDFVVLRDLGRDLTAAEVQALCDRHFGVGADGVLLVETSPPRMIVRNADGSRPEMCGNGLRCVVGHLAHLATSDGLLVVTTDAGDKTCFIKDARAGAFDVEIDMGAARRGPALEAEIGGQGYTFLTVDMGNPHAITFAPYDDRAVDTVGPFVEKLPAGGTNVEFCRVMPDRIEVVVWERGVGRTLACGTGACAVAVAACDTGRARVGAPVIVALPGGPLTITVDASSRVWMRGPARKVYTGEVVIR